MSVLAIDVHGLTCAYRDAVVLNDVNLAIPQGVVLGILGPNGAGKSTLLKASVGLVRPVSGSVQFLGQPLRKVRRRVGYMRQSSTVDWDFPTTVRDVVLMGTYGSLGWVRRPGRAEKQRAQDALQQVGIERLADRPIGQLSGGERQRTFLARILAAQPEIFLLDEPFAGVDAASQEAIAAVLRHLRDAGRTVVVVHHDLATVEQLCDWVVLVNRRVISAGPTSEAFTDASVKRAYGLVAA